MKVDLSCTNVSRRTDLSQFVTKFNKEVLKKEVLNLSLNNLVNLVAGYPVYSILIGFCVSVVLLIIVLLLAAKNSRLGKKVSRLEDLILNQQSFETPDLENLNRELAHQKEKHSTALRHVAMVRFNAFDSSDHGLSYALAVLNDYGDGFVVSSIFTRDESRTYAKQIVEGKPSQPLSPEEERALEKAMAGAG